VHNFLRCFEAVFFGKKTLLTPICHKYCLCIISNEDSGPEPNSQAHMLNFTNNHWQVSRGQEVNGGYDQGIGDTAGPPGYLPRALLASHHQGGEVRHNDGDCCMYFLPFLSSACHPFSLPFPCLVLFFPSLLASICLSPSPLIRSPTFSLVHL
jgi:hypothetical protein